MMIHKSELERAMLLSKANTYGSLEKLVALIPQNDYDAICKVIDAGMAVIKEYENNLRDYLNIKPDTEEEKWQKQVL